MVLNKNEVCVQFWTVKTVILTVLPPQLCGGLKSLQIMSGVNSDREISPSHNTTRTFDIINQ